MALLHHNRLAALTAVCLLYTLTAGCDFLAFTDEGLIKRRIEAHAKAISEEEWGKAAEHYLAKTTWKRADGTGVSGTQAAQEFLDSIKQVRRRGSFYTHVEKVQKLDENRIGALVTFQIHIVESSMSMKYSNLVWKAKMLWVKVGPGDWKIAAIHDVTARKKGKFSPHY